MNAFVIAGGVLAVWAVLIGLLGLRGFPSNKGAERAVVAITAVLFLGAVGSAIGDSTKVGERKGKETEEHKGKETPAAEPGSAQSPDEKPAPATPSGTASPSPGGAPEELKLNADPTALKFDTDVLEAKAGPVNITLTNPSSTPHDISVRGSGVDAKGDQVTDGKTSTVQLADLKAGEYEFYCSVIGHEEAGMKGTLTVK